MEKMLGIKRIKFANCMSIELLTKNGKPEAKIYKKLQSGKNKGELKLLKYYGFRSEESRMKWVKETVENYNANHQSDLKYRAEKKAFVPSFEIGDIYVASWGYDQTNVDAYQVVGKKGSTMAELREIGLASVSGSNGFMSDSVKPVKDSFRGESFFRKVGQYGIKISESQYASKMESERSYYRSWYA